MSNVIQFRQSERTAQKMLERKDPVTKLILAPIILDSLERQKKGEKK